MLSPHRAPLKRGTKAGSLLVHQLTAPLPRSGFVHRPTSVIRSQAARGASGAYRERLIAKAIITPEAYDRISLDDLLSDRRRVMIERAYEPTRNDDEAL